MINSNVFVMATDLYSEMKGNRNRGNLPKRFFREIEDDALDISVHHSGTISPQMLYIEQHCSGPNNPEEDSLA